MSKKLEKEKESQEARSQEKPKAGLEISQVLKALRPLPNLMHVEYTPSEVASVLVKDTSERVLARIKIYLLYN